MKRLLAYLIRWQLSTPILAPVIAYFKSSPTVFGTSEDWIGSAVANLIGGLIFFKVDKFIMRAKITSPLWEVIFNGRCFDCGKTGRVYRLVKTRTYDKIDDPHPEYRCELCSDKKARELGILSD